ILFDGQPITDDVQYRKNIGYMPQIGRYPDHMKVGQLFNMIRNIRSQEKHLDESLYFQFKLDTILDKSMRSLSGGTRQKVSVALAFLFQPEVFILDEPTAGLDPLSSEILKEKIMEEKQKGKLLLITSHVLTDLEEITTDVMYLQDGKVVFNQPITVLQQQTGEEKLGRIIASMMRQGGHKKEVAYLKIAT
ncbi:MAG: ATP-binding cassette domain-containing protein, partial [Flavisolibacter sp.]